MQYIITGAFVICPAGRSYGRCFPQSISPHSLQINGNLANDPVQSHFRQHAAPYSLCFRDSSDHVYRRLSTETTKWCRVHQEWQVQSLRAPSTCVGRKDILRLDSYPYISVRAFRGGPNESCVL